MIVMKFGGTSVGDPSRIEKAAAIVRRSRERNERPVVVVSAHSGVTDALLTLANDAQAGKPVDAAALRKRHTDIATGLGLDPKHVDAELDELEDLIRGVRLLGELSSALTAFFQDLQEHDAAEDVVMLVFTEFGRRMKDNGSGTDHGSGGGAFIIGERVKGGLYAEYPPLEPSQWLNGEDLRHTIDFRGVYGTLLEQWLGLDATAIVGGAYEQIHPFAT